MTREQAKKDRKQAKEKAVSFRMDKQFGKKNSTRSDSAAMTENIIRCDGRGGGAPKPADGVGQSIQEPIIRCDPPKQPASNDPKPIRTCGPADGVRQPIRCDPPKINGGTDPGKGVSTPTGTAPTQPQPAQAQPQFSAEAEYKKRLAASKAYADKAKNAISITMRETNPSPVDTTTEATLNPSGFKGYKGFELNV